MLLQNPLCTLFCGASVEAKEQGLWQCRSNDDGKLNGLTMAPESVHRSHLSLQSLHPTRPASKIDPCICDH